MFKVYQRFATRKEIAAIRDLLPAPESSSWRADNPNGKVFAWLPEREGVSSKTLRTMVDRARSVMVETPTADGDVIVLRYPEGGFIRRHRDVHMHGKHVRLGILLEEATMGGELFVDDIPVPLRPGDGVVYRADQVEHHVTEVVAGERYLLTIGTIFE